LKKTIQLASYMTVVEVVSAYGATVWSVLGYLARLNFPDELCFPRPT
jgi:hypothetical protein